MVEKSLSMLKRPAARSEEPLSEEKEQLNQEPEEPQKKSIADLKTPSTYQGPPDPTAEESTLGYFGRQIAMNASRIGEQIGGRFGNLEKAGKSILTSFPSTGGILGWAMEKLVGPEKYEQLISGKTPEQKQMLPTSEQLKGISQTMTKGYTKPKTKGEEKFQGLTEDIASTLRGRVPTLRDVAVNNLGIPAAANIIEKIVDDNGFGKDKATTFKLGAWTLFSLLGNVNANQYASQLMNQGRNGIPVNLNFDRTRLTGRLNTLSRDPQILFSDPRSALARQEIDAVLRDMRNGQFTTRSLMNTYDGINAAKRNRDLFSFTRNDQNFARRQIDKVRDVVRDEIMTSGAAHPQALENWSNGVQAWSTIHRSQAISNYVQELAQGPYRKIIAGPATALFGVGAYGATKLPAFMSTGGTAAAAGAYKAGQIAYRVYDDPRLAQYYWNAIGAANAQNAPAFINNYQKLNKELEKKEKSKFRNPVNPQSASNKNNK